MSYWANEFGGRAVPKGKRIALVDLIEKGTTELIKFCLQCSSASTTGAGRSPLQGLDPPL